MQSKYIFFSSCRNVIIVWIIKMPRTSKPGTLVGCLWDACALQCFLWISWLPVPAMARKAQRGTLFILPLPGCTTKGNIQMVVEHDSTSIIIPTIKFFVASPLPLCLSHLPNWVVPWPLHLVPAHKTYFCPEMLCISYVMHFLKSTRANSWSVHPIGTAALTQDSWIRLDPKCMS